MRLLVLLFVLPFSATSAFASTLSYHFVAEQTVGTPSDVFDNSIVDDLRPKTRITGTLTFDLTVLEEFSTFRLYAPPAVSVDGIGLGSLGSSPLSVFTTSLGGERLASFSSASPTSVRQEAVAIQADFVPGTLGSDLALPATLTSDDFLDFLLIFSVVDFDADGEALAFENLGYNVTKLAPVPLPATGLLLLAGLVGLCSARRNGRS